MRQFLRQIRKGLQDSHSFALIAAGCSEEVWSLLSEILTRVEDRLSLEDIVSHDWLSPVTSSVSKLTGQELDHSQELEVAMEVNNPCFLIIFLLHLFDFCKDLRCRFVAGLSTVVKTLFVS